MDYFVYYKVHVDVAREVLSKVHALQARLALVLEQAPQLKRRPEQKDGLQTWMEVYANVPSDFAGKLFRAAQDLGLPDLLASERHIELFEDLPACA